MPFLPWVPTGSDITVPVTIPNGGTGQTTAAAAFAALSPLTTAGDLIIENGTPAPSRLAVGSGSQVLGVSGGLPAWVASPGGPPSGTASGDLTGTYPGPVVALINGSAASGQYARGNGTALAMSAIQAADVPTLNQNTTGTAANVTGTVSVANGGTGDASLTAYALLAGGTTSTGAVQSLAGVGTTGQVLTSNGASALPTFQAAAAGGLSQGKVYALAHNVAGP